MIPIPESPGLFIQGPIGSEDPTDFIKPPPFQESVRFPFLMERCLPILANSNCGMEGLVPPDEQQAGRLGHLSDRPMPHLISIGHQEE